MKKAGDFWLSISAPLLVLLAMIVFLHRKDNDRVQSIPSLVTGIGLTCSTLLSSKIRRKKLMKAMLQRNNEII